MIVIPDVHGRLFWYEVVKHKTLGEKVIFLGDYLDPYNDEDETVYPEQAIEVFIDIINYKKENPDEVILLLGNHDLGYFDRSICSCRQDKYRYGEIRDLFYENIDLFQIAYEEKIGNVNCIFTHAGIHTKWLEWVKEMSEDINGSLSEYLNKLFVESRSEFFKYLGIYSRYRGGYEWIGSCIWADCREFMTDRYTKLDNYYQIFGHTRCYNCIITEDFAMLDDSHGYRLSANEENENKFKIEKI